MNLVNDDLKNLNFQFLMVVRECARHHPMEAIWKFNLNAVEIQRMSCMSLEELKELAECGRAVFTILPVTATPTTTPPNILAALLPVTAHA
ncbi:hypothetical protein [Methylobacter tundripaludum]|uniref:hypothetical protein n=1 Tax=Methylobacter tundripaludum TaxID=173365 RepID=UPI0006908B52|nr:hypothetical protein [Methylobacter tundripaludum]